MYYTTFTTEREARNQVKIEIDDKLFSWCKYEPGKTNLLPGGSERVSSVHLGTVLRIISKVDLN